MRILSFVWTTPALLAGRKTCTRRLWQPQYAGLFEAGSLLQAWDRPPRGRGAHRVATIRLIAAPRLESTAAAPDSDWEAEGFAYLESIGAKVNGLRPSRLWHLWRIEEPQEMWVVRFEVVERTAPSPPRPSAILEGSPT